MFQVSTVFSRRTNMAHFLGAGRKVGKECNCTNPCDERLQDNVSPCQLRNTLLRDTRLLLDPPKNGLRISNDATCVLRPETAIAEYKQL